MRNTSMTNEISRQPKAEAPGTPPPVIQFLSLTEAEFVDRFRPVPNHLLATAGLDFRRRGSPLDLSGPRLASLRPQPLATATGRASARGRACQYVWSQLVAVSVKNKTR